MVSLYSAEGPLQKVGEVLGGEVDGEELSTVYRPFELGCLQAPAEKNEWSHSDGCRLLVEYCSNSSGRGIGCKVEGLITSRVCQVGGVREVCF